MYQFLSYHSFFTYIDVPSLTRVKGTNSKFQEFIYCMFILQDGGNLTFIPSKRGINVKEMYEI